MSRWLNFSASVLRRSRAGIQGRAYPRANTERTLLELEYIIEQLADFYEPMEARQWVFAPQKLLDGASPAQLIRAGRIDEVMRFVGQLRDAVHF